MANTRARPPASADTRQLLILAAEDASAVLPLSCEAGWNQVEADWRFMLAAGHGIAVRGVDGTFDASAVTLPLGPRLAWIGMVLVTARARRHGLGRRLLSACLDHAAATGRAAGLDATELGRPVYLQRGFRDVYPLRRWLVPPVALEDCQPISGIKLAPVRHADLARIAAFDRAHSGMDRTPILAHLLARVPNRALLAQRADGTLTGFVFAREGRLATQIGPIVAQSDAIGAALAERALAARPAPCLIDVPDRHTGLIRRLAALGASSPRGFMRMCRGDAGGLDDAAHVFALAGPELA